jgi:hypothetical protein
MPILLAYLIISLLSHSAPVIAVSKVAEAIPQLDGLTFDPPSALKYPIRLGGQDWTHCCLLAINSSLWLDPTTGGLEYTKPTFLNSSVPVSEYIAAATHDKSSFPCGATFDGNNGGAPEVRVPYSWCGSNCAGWQISHRGALTQWIGPLVGFILPCLAFCLTIPRRRKLAMPPWVFHPELGNLIAIVSYIFRLAVALLLVSLDTIGWLCLCFALAGPMLLSAVFEAWVDKTLLQYLWRKIVVDSRIPNWQRKDPVLTLRLRAQLLLLIVVGNVDINRSRRAG